MRLEITGDCCATARKLIAEGLDAAEVLEFCRGDMVCLRGTAKAFAGKMVRESSIQGPRHVRYDPLDVERLGALRDRGRGLVR